MSSTGRRYTRVTPTRPLTIVSNGWIVLSVKRHPERTSELHFEPGRSVTKKGRLVAGRRCLDRDDLGRSFNRSAAGLLRPTLSPIRHARAPGGSADSCGISAQDRETSEGLSRSATRYAGFAFTQSGHAPGACRSFVCGEAFAIRSGWRLWPCIGV